MISNVKKQCILLHGFDATFFCNKHKGYRHTKSANCLQVGFSPSKIICVFYLIESPLKMMKNAFYFVLKAPFVLMIFKFLPLLFGHVGKTA